MQRAFIEIARQGKRSRREGSIAFTLIEVLVTVTLLVLLVSLLLSMVNFTSSTWRRTTGKMEQFRAARKGFDAMTRRVSEAVLNTYWGYQYDSSNGYPKQYERESELRFICGPTATLDGANTNTTRHRPTHGIFFQAPAGLVDDPNFDGLGNLLNTWGYYIEFNGETRPPFLDSLPNPPPRRWRYRLMELIQPSNKLSIYAHTSGNNGYSGREWFTDGLNASPPTARVLAENIIALVLFPKLSPKDEAANGYSDADLAPDYLYDTTANGQTDPNLNSHHQLPPLIQITMVAIDEGTAARITRGDTPPDFGLDELFKRADQYKEDLATLEDTLTGMKIPYDVFTTTVGIRAAKWSRY